MDKQSTDSMSIYSNAQDHCDVSCSLDEPFRRPAVPIQKPHAIAHPENKLKELLGVDSSFDFQQGSMCLFQEPAFLSGRPSLLFDDGKESLGILPQFKLPTGSRSNNTFELECADSFLVSTERQSDSFVDIGRPSLLYDGRESLGILPQFKLDFMNRKETLAELEYCLLSPTSHSNIVDREIIDHSNRCSESLLSKFQRDCEAIESGDFQPDVKDITDENYSVYVEANFIASKIADNSILDISQEGGTILDKTPQPDFVEDEDSMNKSEKIFDTQSVHRQVDLLLPARNQSLAPITSELKSPSIVLEHLSSLITQQADDQVRQVLHNAMREIARLLDPADDDVCDNQQMPRSPSVADEDDSGHSSTGNEKEVRDCNGVLDLSLRHHSSDNQALDLSFSKESVPRRLSITFSHQGDPDLPERQPSNNLKQQTLHMRKLWSSVNPNGTAGASSDGSVLSNESKTSSTGSMRVKLKPKKSESDLFKRGPLKAVVPLASLNTSVTVERGAPLHPPPKLRPVAQSTPEERSSAERRRTATAGMGGSPLARPGRTTPILQRGKRISMLDRSSSMEQPKAVGTQTPEGSKTLCRGKSSAELKQYSGADDKKRPALRRCYSVGGKENVSLQLVRKQSTAANSRVEDKGSLSKLPQKTAGIRPQNFAEKLHRN